MGRSGDHRLSGELTPPSHWWDRPWIRRLRSGRGRPFGFLLLLALVAALLALDGRGLRPLRLAWFDVYQVLMPRVLDDDPPVLIVEIDEKSLHRLDQWPWPRGLLSRLVARIAEGKPQVIGLDILMPESDRLSPERLASRLFGVDAETAARLRRLGSSDAELAETLRPLPVVLGVAGLDAGEGGRASALAQRPVRVFGGGDAGAWPYVRHFGAALRSVDPIHGAARGLGLLSVEPDAGVVRRMPLVAAVGDTLVAGFGLEMVRVAADAPGFAVWVGAAGIDAVGIRDYRIPTQPDGTVWLHYTRGDGRRFVSAADVLTGAVDPGVFAGKLVIVGVTALAASDTQATPVDERMPGPEIHAQLIEGILGGDLLSRPWWTRWAEAAALAAGGIALVLAVPATPVRAAPAVPILAVAAVGGLGVGLYRKAHVLFDATAPAVGLAALFTAMLGVTLIEAERQRRALRDQVERQREAAARLAGELEAARRIQMGILPSPGALAGERRVAVYAFLEPAREVGGDLYDFFRLDDHRVFFLIGDVSGKGLPGSLFMAVSKALCKSTALRRGADVAAVFREANAEISRDNTEAMFVTAFAGILDARTGVVEYCNAGHEPPWILGAGGPARPGTGGDGALRRLNEGGGPPLCVLDDFPYAAATHRLAPGESLCLVTDGVIEATDRHEAFYGRERLEALLAAAAAGTPESVGAAVAADVGKFGAGVEPADDLAILIVRWSGPGAPGAC